ncbi:MAG: ATP-dependent helicase [Cytophagales bacterium]
MHLDLSTLNPAQREAVEHTEGASLVIAGPGSGKTRVLTFRVGHLIQNLGVPPYQIMVLTFTRKAAQEMMRRLEEMIGAGVKKLQIGTFHSIFYRILRRYAPQLGFASDISIYDSSDSRTLIKRIVKERKLDEKAYLPKVVLRRIGEAKRAFLNAKAYGEEDVWLEEDKQHKLKDFHLIYTSYENRCKAANAMDYDDLLFQTYRLFQEHPEVLQECQARFRYLLVDEFQDTDNIQYAILKFLAKQHGNLCVIGDDAQSIYRFRGAEISNILGFETHFLGGKVFKLQQNYRSTKRILGAAKALINHNEHATKDLFTENALGDPVMVFPMSNDFEEAFFIAKEVQASTTKGGLQYDQMAVIYRSNRQSRLLEEALLKQNIPYQITGGLSFYERKEIKDILAYLQLIVNKDHEEALWRAINLPKRNIGPATITRIQAYAKRKKCTVWEAAVSAKDWVGGRTGEQLQAFIQLITRYRGRLTTQHAHEVTEGVLRDSGLQKLMKGDVSIEGVTRWENVEELLGATLQFVKKNPQQSSLADFLRDIALLETAKTTDQNAPRVRLMTAHRAKGLEFTKVFITGAEEKLFPHNFSMYSNADIEEERRLFFVAMTRAKKELVITYATQRHVLSSLNTMTPSRFLKEIEKGGAVMPPILAQPRASHKQRAHTKPSRRSGSSSESERAGEQPRKTKRDLIDPASQARQIDATPFQAGTEVSHPRFGRGTIISLEQDRMHPKVVVHFLSGGQRSLLLAFAKLKVLASDKSYQAPEVGS